MARSAPPLASGMSAGAAPTPTQRSARPRDPLVLAAWLTIRDPMGAFGVAVLAIVVLAAVLAPWISPYSPVIQHPDRELAAPSSAFFLGTDEFGRDLLSRIVWGARVSLLVGIVAVALGAVIGVGTGLLSGYVGGWVDAVIMRIYDAVLAFPTILLGIGVVTVLGPGNVNVALALATAQTPVFARLARASVLSEREREYVTAAVSIGAGRGRIMARHVLPNILGPIIVQLSLAMSFAVITEAALSFLGLGTQPPTASWGQMLNDSRAYLREAPWYGIWPGVALGLLLISLNFLADVLRDSLDPRRVQAA